MKVKEESEKVGLKLNIQKTKIIITSWQRDRETVETVTDFIFLGCRITADGDCSHEMKRHLLLERKAMTNLLLLLLSHFSRVRLCATPEMATHQASLSLGFSRQKHWSGLPFPSPMHESEKWKWSHSVMSNSSNPMDCSPPGSSIHGIFQEKVLEWGAIAFSDDQPRHHIKKQRHYFANRGLSSQSYGFCSSHVWMRELDYKEAECWRIDAFWTVVLEKTLESPLVCKEIQSVRPKGNQSWIFIGRTDAAAEIPVLWPPDVKNWLIGKDPDSGKDWREEEKGMTENETVGWHHRLDGHEFEQTLGVGDGQGSMAYFIPWSLKESDMTEQLNWVQELTI